MPALPRYLANKRKSAPPVPPDRVNRRSLRISRRRFRYGLLVGISLAIIMYVITSQQLFEHAAYWLKDLLYTPGPTSGKIVIVAVDDLSIGAYNRSIGGWPRNLHAELLKFLSNSGARVVAFDILFAEQNAYDTDFAEAIQQARQSPAGTRTVLAAVGKQGSDINAVPGHSINYSDMLTPVQTLAANAHLLGHASVLPDADHAVRWIPLTITSNDIQYLSLSAAAYLSYLRVPAEAISQVVRPSASNGALELTPQRRIPVDSYGRMLTNYFGVEHTFETYSYRAVHDGEVDPAVFRDKIVLIGAVNATGVTDRYAVPISRNTGLMAGVEIHANAIETLLQNRPLVAQSQTSQIIVTVATAMLSALLLSQMRWYLALAVSAATWVTIFIYASLTFSLYGQVTSIFYPGLALALVVTALLIMNLLIETQRRLRLQRLLDSITALDERQMILPEIVRRMRNDIRDILGGQEAYVWLWDQQAKRLDVSGIISGAAAGGDTGPLDGSRSAAIATLLALAKQACETRQMVLSGNLAAAPLILQTHLLGAVGGTRTELSRLSADQVYLFRNYSERVAPILANSILYTGELRQKDLLAAVLAGAPEPMLVLNRNLVPVRVNQAAAALLRLSEADSAEPSALALPLWAMLRRVNGDDDAIIAIEGALKTSAQFRHEIRIGSQYFTLQGAPLRYPQPGWVLAFNDITSLKELDATRTQMLRMASHDLKNPLSIVLGYLELLNSGQLDIQDEATTFVQIVSDAVTQMKNITNGLLDVERARTTKPNLQPLSLKVLIERVVEEFTRQAEIKQQTLRMIIAESAETLIVPADAQQLSQAFGNLVSNAIKYTPAQGTITLRVNRRGNFAVVEVADTGYGISRKAQEGLFQPFYRVRTMATAEIPGTGLGLSLVKAVIDAHGGRVWVDSDEGKGSTFSIELAVQNTSEVSVEQAPWLVAAPLAVPDVSVPGLSTEPR